MDFANKVKRSFSVVKNDIDRISSSLGQWIRHFNSKHDYLEEKVKRLEAQVELLNERLRTR